MKDAEFKLSEMTDQGCSYIHRLPNHLPTVELCKSSVINLTIHVLVISFVIVYIYTKIKLFIFILFRI